MFPHGAARARHNRPVVPRRRPTPRPPRSRARERPPNRLAGAAPRRSVGFLLGLAVVPALVATLVGLVWLWPREPAGPTPGFGERAEMVDGVVTGTRRVSCDELAGQEPGVQPGPEGAMPCRTEVVTVRLTSGPDRGRPTAFELVEGPGQPRLDTGDRIVLGRSQDADGTSYFFSDFQRRVPMVWLAVLFALVIVGIGRLKGFTALVGVAATFVLLVEFVLPAMLSGSSPLAVSVVGASASMFVILYLAHGVSAMTTTALLGTLASLAITGVLAAVFVDAAHLLNIGADETAFLQLGEAQLNLQGLLLGGIIIGSLGVLNDVTVTQASAVWQLAEAEPAAGFADLYRRAMTVGRDHIASTVDTLVLAYAGASLPLLLLFTLVNRPFGDVVAGSLVAEEVVRAMVGGIGLAASVPITTALATFAVTRASRPAAVARPGAEVAEG